MKARLERRDSHDSQIVLEPETDHERLLLAAWMKYDQNAVSLVVERFQNGLIERVTLLANV